MFCRIGIDLAALHRVAMYRAWQRLDRKADSSPVIATWRVSLAASASGPRPTSQRARPGWAPGPAGLVNGPVKSEHLAELLAFLCAVFGGDTCHGAQAAAELHQW